MLSNFIKFLGGNPHQREVEKYAALARQINALEADYEKLSDEALRAKTDEFRAKIAAELGVSSSELARVNNIDDPSKIRVGQELIVPGN